MVELQKAIYDRLNSVALGVPVYDAVPQGKDFPFVVIGDDLVIDYDTDDSRGFQVTASIHSYSNHRGTYQTKLMQSSIYDLLHRAELPVLGYNLIDSFCTYQTTISESDGVVRHGVMRFNFLLERI
jgi:hypothetical protein